MASSNNSSSSDTRLLKCLQAQHVSCKVVDCDHYRIRGGLAVETDYIVAVKSTCPEGSMSFPPFHLSKTYAAFRTLALQLKHAADASRRRPKSVAAVDTVVIVTGMVEKLQKYCDLVFHMIDAQSTSYVGKVNYLYVTILAKQRVQILDDVLSATCHYFPSQPTSGTDQYNYDPFLVQVADIVEAFFLTDHVVMEDGPEDGSDKVDTESHSDGHHPRRHHHRDLSHISLDNLNPLAWIGMKTGGVSPSNTKSSRSMPFLFHDEKSTSTTTSTKKATVTMVVPITRRSRQSLVQRDKEEAHLLSVGSEAMLLLDDDRSQPTVVAASNRLPNYAQPVPTVLAGNYYGVIRSNSTMLGQWLDANPLFFAAIAAVTVIALQKAADSVVTMDADMFALCIFASFCLGLHTPRPMVGGYDRAPTMKGAVRNTNMINDRSGRKLLQRSMMAASPLTQIRRVSMVTKSIQTKTNNENDHTNTLGPSARTIAAAVAVEEHLAAGMTSHDGDHSAPVEMDDTGAGHELSSPMAMFPEDGEIGAHFNCWSKPEACIFHVRGPDYLCDKRKVPSDDYIFPCRGVDLFLTDACPQNVGKNPGVMGGRLREVPTFVINFRLPWGVLLLYCEIPAKFVPFLTASTSGPDEQANLLPELEEMTPPERTTARWLMGDSAHKNKTLKIVPVVVDGPWVVKSVVGGKPALLGAKLPIVYVYQPAEGSDAPYLEADLDIAASSAARGILSVTRSYTQILTINLGFVIQGNEADELPEQMLTGARLHGIDPLTAPCFPPMFDEMTMEHMAAAISDEEESV